MKVDKDDVITASYMDVNPPMIITKTLKVETTPPDFSNISPAHNSHNVANTEIEFDVIDSDSGVEFYNTWIVFGIDEDSDGTVERAYERSPSRGRITVRNTKRFALRLLDDSEIALDSTIYWWAVTRDTAGNLAVLDRQRTLNGSQDLCSPYDFPRTFLEGVDVSKTRQVAGCQPYAVRIAYNSPFIERIMVGPWWNPTKSGNDKTEYDPTNARSDSILVDFSEEMAPFTIKRFDFTVNGRIPQRVSMFTGHGDYIFLTVSDIMAGSRPTIEVVGEIRDIHGNIYQANNNRPIPQTTPAPPPTNSINPVDLLIRIIQESASIGILTNQIANLLSNLFIEYFITPTTGETVDQARERLSTQ